MSIRKMNLGSADLTSPACRAVPAVMNDTTDLARPYKALWANSSGTAHILPIENDDDEDITVQVVAGTPVPFAVRRVFADSTASLIGIEA